MNEQTFLPQSTMAFLKENRMLTIATLSSETNNPQLSFVYYIFDDTMHIVITISQNSRKFKNIISNSHVGILIATEIPPQVLEVEGTAEIVTDQEKKNELWKQMSQISTANEQSNVMPPLLQLHPENLQMFSISINSFTFSDFEKEKAIYQGTPHHWQEKLLSS